MRGHPLQSAPGAGERRGRFGRAALRRALAAHFEEPIAGSLARLGFSPNQLTLLGLALAVASAALIATDRLLAGGLVLAASGLFDLFDGSLARATGRASAFGALLDSTVDRLCEIAVLLGVLLLYVRRDDATGVVLAYLALAASVMVSYVRGRAEGLGVSTTVGLMTRPERVALLSGGLVVARWWAGGLPVALGVMAAVSAVAVVQRLVDARRRLDR